MLQAQVPTRKTGDTHRTQDLASSGAGTYEESRAAQLLAVPVSLTDRSGSITSMILGPDRGRLTMPTRWACPLLTLTLVTFLIWYLEHPVHRLRLRCGTSIDATNNNTSKRYWDARRAADVQLAKDLELAPPEKSQEATFRFDWIFPSPLVWDYYGQFPDYRSFAVPALDMQTCKPRRPFLRLWDQAAAWSTR